MTTLRPRHLDAALGAVFATATILVLGALVPAGSAANGMAAIGLLLERGWPAGLWVLAAAGLGSVLTRFLPDREAAGSLRVALGVAGLVVVDLVLGGLGLLGRGHEVVAWTIILVPASLALVDGFLRPRGSEPPPDRFRLAIPIGIAIGVLLLASTSTPGWLWGTEFGGYDALSYHLQLPREWWFAGGLVETPHNAYGYLPGGVSAAFLHLMTLVGDPADAAVSCQVLVALLTIAAADTTATLAAAWWSRSDDDVSTTRARLVMLALLSTPWVVVTGSLAYDEAAVMLGGAAALAIALQAARADANVRLDLRIGIALGLTLGLTILAKASSGVLVVIPVAIAAAIMIPPRRWPAIVAGTAIAGIACCLPWLVRNADWTGNPVFPFATGVFGPGDWTAEQIARFAAGHDSPGIVGGASALVQEFLLDDLVGTLPAGEPWRPQWWWLPIGGLAALGITLAVKAGDDPDHQARRRRGLAMLATVVAALVCWALFTHAKARFLLAIAPLLAAAVGVAWCVVAERRRTVGLALASAAWLAPIAPVVMFATERDGSPGAAIGADEAFDGRLEARMIAEADPRTAARLRAEASPAFIVRDLGPEARVLLVGVANPFHLFMQPIDATDGAAGAGAASRVAYTTVWTRGPLEHAFDGTTDAAPDLAATAVVESLRDQGFTHLLIAPTMLEVWSASGWLDPALDPARIAALETVAGVRTAHRFGDGGVLLELGHGSGS